MTTNPLGVLVAGFDGIGSQDHQNAMYLPAFAAHPDFELVAAVDLGGRAGAAGVSEREGIEHITDYEQALADPRVDVVSVAAPLSDRARHIATAIRAGKHVLADKPLAASAPEAEQLANLAESHRTVLVPAHHQRLRGAVRSAAGAVRGGRVGLPWNVQADFLVAGGDLVPSGELVNLALYPVDVLRSILGLAVRRVHAITRTYWHGGADDFAILQLDHDHGVTSTITCGRMRAVAGVPKAGLAVHRYRISGSHGVLLVDALKPQLSVRTAERNDVRWTGGDTVTALLDVLRDGIRSGRPAIDARDAVETQRVVDAARRSVDLGHPVEIAATAEKAEKAGTNS
jgi:predicted dehydrogenase